MSLVANMSAEPSARAREPRIVILGGGFSGTLLAVYLLRKAKKALQITIVDRSSSPGRGVAYATERPYLLLNVPAGRMSALEDDPEHFVRWLQERHATCNAQDFVPRHLYGSYIGELFTSACREREDIQVEWIEDEAQRVISTDGRLRVELRRGDHLSADQVVLATGTPPPPVPSLVQKLDKQFLAGNPWEQDAPQGIPIDGRVLILGSGLTAMDQIAALNEQGFRGSILMLSRRGLLPFAYSTQHAQWSSEWTATLPHDLNTLLAAVREQIRLAQQQKVDWRAVIESLRSHIPAVWSRLSYKHRNRFLQHLQVHWNVARHRMPPQLSDLVRSYLDTRSLTVEAGTLLNAEHNDGRVLIQFRRRGRGDVCTTRVDKVINCTGTFSVFGPRGTLISRLVEDGLALPDHIGLGIETAPDGTVITTKPTVQQRIYAIGPLRRATIWETTAVAEIRVQASELAETLLHSIAHPNRVKE